MRIVLLGATGFVGAALLSEALSRGHEVTAIARHPEKLEPPRSVSNCIFVFWSSRNLNRDDQ